jgi:hypothetical protein
MCSKGDGRVIFATAMAIGFLAGTMRSAFAIAMIAILIGTAFTAAAVTSSGPVSFLPLLLAVAGYNVGLVNLVIGMLAFSRLRPALAR